MSSLFRASRVQLGLLRLFSCGDLRWLRDVTGKAPLSSEVVELVILWCYGFGTVLDFFVWFRCESPAGRLPGQPCARWSAPLRVREPQRVAREEEKREKTRTRLVFSTVRFGRRPPAADRIRLSVWGGAPPMSMVFWGHAHSSSDISFNVKDNVQIFYVCCKHTLGCQSLTVIHTFLTYDTSFF